MKPSICYLHGCPKIGDDQERHHFIPVQVDKGNTPSGINCCELCGFPALPLHKASLPQQKTHQSFIICCLQGAAGRTTHGVSKPNRQPPISGEIGTVDPWDHITIHTIHIQLRPFTPAQVLRVVSKAFPSTAANILGSSTLPLSMASSVKLQRVAYVRTLPCTVSSWQFFNSARP